MRHVERVLDRRVHRRVDVVAQDHLACAWPEVSEPERLAGRLFIDLGPEPHHAVAFDRRMRADRSPLGDVAIDARDGDARSFSIESPTVVTAFERSALDSARGERNVAVRTPVDEDTRLATPVTEHDERRSHQLDGDRAARTQLLAGARGVPGRTRQRDRVPASRVRVDGNLTHTESMVRRRARDQRCVRARPRAFVHW